MSNFKFYCKQCDSTSYNVNHAGFKNNHPYNVTCHKCPYQASCVNGIKSRGNYWATTSKYSHGKVTFTLCPSSYCCVSLEKCISYNTCNENREGRLCGDCQKDYVISVFTRNECVSKGECEKMVVLWALYLIGVVASCLFVLYSADAWKAVVNASLMVTRQKQKLFTASGKRELNHKENDSDYDDIHQSTIHDLREPLIHGNETQLACNSDQEQNQEDGDNDFNIHHSTTCNQVNALIRENNETRPSSSKQDNIRPDSAQNTTTTTTNMKFVGLVKTAFFFYQTASIIRVPASAKTAYTTSGLTGLVTSFFNIKIDVTATGSTTMTFCLFDTSNVVGVEAFRSSVPPV